MSQVLSNLNDNHFYGFKSSPTGEDFRLNPAGYREVRPKKSYQARHLLNDLRKQAEEQCAIEQANAEAFKKFKARESAREENNNVKKQQFVCFVYIVQPIHKFSADFSSEIPQSPA